MAQKNLPPASKLTKILEYLKSTMQVYTLKELEKILQSVASVNQMQAKDYLQALQDENLIRVEKMGSGNWYWCFTSDAKRSREKVMNGLQLEHDKLVELTAVIEREVAQEMSRHENDGDVDNESGTNKRQSLLEAQEELLKESAFLDKELALYCDNDPAEVKRKMNEIQKLRNSALLWTDNIEALECFLAPFLGDRARLGEIMHAACGNEYVVGEGLQDL